MQDEDGQILEAHSISAGLDYPGTGPEHACLRDTRPRALRRASPTTRRWPRSARVAELEGIIPALESAHAVAWVLGAGRRGDAADARPDLPVRARRQGPRRGAARKLGMTGDRHRRRADRGRVRGRARARGADAVPDGRLPDVEARCAIGEAYADGRRRPRRARRAVLGPARRRPGDPRRRHARRWPPARRCTACSRPARGSPSASRSCSCATRTRSSPAASSASPAELADARASAG